MSDKRIIIANKTLGIVTRTGLEMLWSTHPAAQRSAIAFTPAKAVDFLRQCIPKDKAETTFILPIENWTQDTIEHDHPLMKPLAHLWLLRIEHVLATGQYEGKPSAATLVWSGTQHAAQRGEHMQALKQQALDMGFENPTLYDRPRIELLTKAMQSMEAKETTPKRQLAFYQSQRIHELIEQIGPDAHPVKMARVLQQAKEHIEAGHTLH